MGPEAALDFLGGAWDALADPWRETIVQRAFFEIVLLGLVGGALGAWIVLYGLSYSAESLSHAMFPGLVVAALVGAPIVLGGAGGLVIAAIAIALAARVEGVGSDNAVAIVVSGMLGLGAVLALSADSPPGLQGLLFGDVFGVTDFDLWLSLALVCATLLALRVLHRQLLAVGFDHGSARAFGGRPLLADAALLVLLGLALLVGVQALGALLVVTILVGPAAAARLVAHRILPMMALGTAIALLAGMGGLYLSYYVDTAGGASIAATVVVVYLALRAASAGGAWEALSRRATRAAARA
jgi:ABC-type Mn2+/Zn2+ transport system permease subunit